MVKVYGVTGMPLAGKTTVADILEDKGYQKVDMGDVVREEMEQKNLPPEKTGEFVNKQRDKHGMDAIARLTVPYAQDCFEEEQDVVITGMRSLDEKEKFEEEFDYGIDVIAIWAPDKVRKKRRKARGRPEDEKGQSFTERDYRELKNGVGDLVAKSDYLIKNYSIDKQKLKEKVEEILEDD
ncbi:MAG: AAA family ATPase [Candidatus Nanohaloarchaeota archaeon QJJ-9]|nr:AAA family ATPase [Candidatus Nanohaloarchaeota archaeon QJJ-9]